MRLVRIFIETPTFDRITKDQRAKIADMVSTIGGNMGLLLGFSIISGVEIVLFMTRMILVAAGKKVNI